MKNNIEDKKNLNKQLNLQQQPNNNENLNQQLNQVLILLQTLQSQAKKISIFQEQTYQWNLKHHSNLKNVLNTFNRLNSIIGGGVDQQKSNNNNNNTSTNTTTTTTTGTQINSTTTTTINEFENDINKSFHQKIMEVYDPLDPFSDDLQFLIMQIDKSLFSQLQDESIEIIYPFILKWLKEESSYPIIILSLVILWETTLKFRKLIIENIKFREINKKILICLNDLESKGIVSILTSQDVFPFTDEEYFNLKKFLQ